MEKSLEEFKSEQIRKGKGRRKVTVTNSWGVYDIYKHIRKNGWYNIGRPLTEHEFYSIVRGVNKRLAEKIAMGQEITLPMRMGRLELHKYEKGVSLIDGKLKNTYPINWGETWKLWFSDEEAFKDKTIIRDEEPMVYHVKYMKKSATYENKQFYQFKLNRFIKKKLKENIKNGRVDTIWN